MNVSVIVTSFNRLKYLARSMESIKSQLEEGDEFVIVEDGKETEFEWRRYLDDQKVNYQFFKTGNGIYRSGVKAKNVALRNSKNPIIIINDPEVMHISPCIIEMKKRLAENPRLFIVPGEGHFGRWPNDTYEESTSIIEKSMSPFIGAVMRDELIAVGGWDERFVYWGNDDTDLMHRLGLNGCQTDCMTGLKFFHQFHNRPPAEAMGDYNEGFLYEKNKSIVANIGKEWGNG